VFSGRQYRCSGGRAHRAGESRDRSGQADGRSDGDRGEDRVGSADELSLHEGERESRAVDRFSDDAGARGGDAYSVRGHGRSQRGSAGIYGEGGSKVYGALELT